MFYGAVVFTSDICQRLGSTFLPVTECDIDDLLACQAAVIAGRYELIPYKSYVQYLDALKLAQMHLRYKCLFSIRATHQYRAVTNSISKIELTQFPGSIRKQPFGILLLGPPGCGKSKATFEIAEACQKAVGHTLNAEEMVVLNESDQYQSEYRSSHKVVVFDDVGSSKLSTVKEDPYRKVIDFINNIPRSALNPHLELKGNVQIRPDIVMMTANQIDHVYGTQTAPQAFMRRFPIKILMLDRERAVLFESCKTDPCPEFAKHSNEASRLGFKNITATSHARTITQMLNDIVPKYLEHEIEQKKYMEAVVLPSVSQVSRSPFQKLVRIFCRKDRSDMPVAQSSDEQSVPYMEEKQNQNYASIRLVPGDVVAGIESQHFKLNNDSPSDSSVGPWLVPKSYLPIPLSERYAFTANQLVEKWGFPFYGESEDGIMTEEKEKEVSRELIRLKRQLPRTYLKSAYHADRDGLLYCFDERAASRDYSCVELYTYDHFLDQVLRRKAAFEICRKLNIRNTHGEETYENIISKLPVNTLVVAKDLYVGNSDYQCNLFVLHEESRSLLLLFDNEKSDFVIDSVRSKLMMNLRNTTFPHGKYSLYTARFDGDKVYDAKLTNGTGKYEHLFLGALQPNVAGSSDCKALEYQDNQS